MHAEIVRPIRPTVLGKARFWENHAGAPLNERQRDIITRLLNGFDGKLTSSKWAKLEKCSQDTALRDIDDLLKRGILVKDAGGGRSTSYSLAELSRRPMPTRTLYFDESGFTGYNLLGCQPADIRDRKALTLTSNHWSGSQPPIVMAVLVTASRGLPDLRRLMCGPRASPRSDAIHDFLRRKTRRGWPEQVGTSPAMTPTASETARGKQPQPLRMPA